MLVSSAALAAATLAALPIGLFYDLMLAAIATAWLLREGRYRLAEWEKIVLAGLFFLTLNPRSFSEILQLPIGPLVTVGFVAYVVAHVVRSRPIVTSSASVELLCREPASTRSAPSRQ